MSKYYTPPSALSPNTTAHAGTFNTDFAGVDAAFTLVAADMVKTLSHATLTINPLNQTSGQMAGKPVGFDSTGLSLVAAASAGTWRGTYVAVGTQYNQGDIVQDSATPFSVYYSVKNFTSGVSLAADIAAGNVSLALNLANVPLPLAVSVKSASFVAAVGNMYVISGGGADINVSLPAGAGLVAGATTIIGVSIHSAFAHNVSVVPNGTDKIDGVNSTVLLYATASGTAHALQFYWSGATNGWITI